MSDKEIEMDLNHKDEDEQSITSEYLRTTSKDTVYLPMPSVMKDAKSPPKERPTQAYD